jgi:hypothetical protein
MCAYSIPPRQPEESNQQRLEFGPIRKGTSEQIDLFLRSKDFDLLMRPPFEGSGLARETNS